MACTNIVTYLTRFFGGEGLHRTGVVPVLQHCARAPHLSSVYVMEISVTVDHAICLCGKGALVLLIASYETCIFV